MNIKWEGVMPAVTTQFNANDELDLNMFKKNILFASREIYAQKNHT